MAIDIFSAFFYHQNMGRPPKKKSLLMNVPLRIMLTAEQKELIVKAADGIGVDMAAWARPILLEAAKKSVATTTRVADHQG